MDDGSPCCSRPVPHPSLPIWYYIRWLRKMRFDLTCSVTLCTVWCCWRHHRAVERALNIDCCISLDRCGLGSLPCPWSTLCSPLISMFLCFFLFCIRSLLVISDDLPLSPRHEQAKLLLERARLKARSNHIKGERPGRRAHSDQRPAV